MAIGSPTRDFTRTNPTATALNTIIKTAQVSVFRAVLSNGSDALAVNAAGAQLIFEEIGTTGMLLQFNAAGTQAYIIGDAHALDIDTLAIRIGRMFDSSAGSRTSSGVYTCGGGGTVTVTEATSLESLE